MQQVVLVVSIARVGSLFQEQLLAIVSTRQALARGPTTTSGIETGLPRDETIPSGSRATARATAFLAIFGM